MTAEIKKIQNAALELGACDKIEKVSGFPSLVRLLFSPQGAEFCEKHNFPDLATLQNIKSEVKKYGVFIDCGEITLRSRQNTCLVGNTHATIKASGVNYAHTIILMHGASATIEASRYAVVKVINISGREVKINKDNTVVAL